MICVSWGRHCFKRDNCGFALNAVINGGKQWGQMFNIEARKFSVETDARSVNGTPFPTESVSASHEAGDSEDKSGNSADKNLETVHERTTSSHFPAESATATSLRLILDKNGWKEDTVNTLQKEVVKITSELIVDVASQLKNIGVAWNFLQWARTQECCEHRDEIFTKVLGRLGRHRSFSSAWHLLDMMRQHGMEVNYAFSIFIHRLIRAKMVDGVVKAMNGMRYLTVIPTVPLYTSAMQFLLKANCADEAQRLYHQMEQDGLPPDKKLYEVITIGFSRAGKLDDALIILQDMQGQGYIPQISVYTTLMVCLSTVGKLNDGRKLYLEMIRNHRMPEVFTSHELACALHGENSMELVEKFLEVLEAKGSDLKIHTYNNLLQYLFNIGKHDEAMEVFHRIPGNRQAGRGFEMQSRECYQNLDTYKVCISGLCKGGHLLCALGIFKAMLVCGPRPDGDICSHLLLMLSNAKVMDEALELLPPLMKLKVYKAVDLIKAKGGKVSREPGPVKGGTTVIAFVEDPDGCKFELIQRGPTPEPLCQVMLRVGDLNRSISSYEKAFGMQLLTTRDNPEQKV